MSGRVSERKGKRKKRIERKRSKCIRPRTIFLCTGAALRLQQFTTHCHRELATGGCIELDEAKCPRESPGYLGFRVKIQHSDSSKWVALSWRSSLTFRGSLCGSDRENSIASETVSNRNRGVAYGNALFANSNARYYKRACVSGEREKWGGVLSVVVDP